MSLASTYSLCGIFLMSNIIGNPSVSKPMIRVESKMDRISMGDTWRSYIFLLLYNHLYLTYCFAARGLSRVKAPNGRLSMNSPSVSRRHLDAILFSSAERLHSIESMSMLMALIYFPTRSNWWYSCHRNTIRFAIRQTHVRCVWYMCSGLYLDRRSITRTSDSYLARNASKAFRKCSVIRCSSRSCSLWMRCFLYVIGYSEPRDVCGESIDVSGIVAIGGVVDLPNANVGDAPVEVDAM